jgi:ABC-type uncharacterized transport system substrate-binding protein
MKQKVTILAFSALLLPLSAIEAQQPKKVTELGFLFGATRSANTGRIEAFRQGLHELGYVEGKHIVIEPRYAEGKLDRLNELAAELVRLKVNIIVTGGSPATRSAKEATVTIPIVMAQDTDPVGNGFVATLARPGGNITGLSTLAPEISGKQLELLKEIVPKLSRAAVFGTSTRAETAQSLDEIKRAAGTMKVQIQYLDVLKPEDIETSVRAALNGRAEAFLWHVSGSLGRGRRNPIIELTAKSRRPAIYAERVWVEDGGLISYGHNGLDLDRRAANYVDKILKGAKPADLPVEQPKKFELMINLKAAKQIGLTIPQSVLYRADRLIR